MALTTAQLQTLQTDITVTRASVVYHGQTLLEWWNLGENNTIAMFYNEIAVPTYTVWATLIMIAQTMQGAGFDWTRVDNLTVGKSRIMDFMISASPMNFALPSVRAGVEACFAVDVADGPCRQAIYNGSVRPARYGEQLYATGTGQPPTNHGVGPSIMAFEGFITVTDVEQAHFV